MRLNHIDLPSSTYAFSCSFNTGIPTYFTQKRPQTYLMNYYLTEQTSVIQNNITN